MLSPRSASHTASVTCCVVALPPRSGVCRLGIGGDALDRPHQPGGRVLLAQVLEHHRPPVQKVPTGLAMPLPMMSKAEPWIGSNIEG